jgi:hypothetical protein
MTKALTGVSSSQTTSPTTPPEAIANVLLHLPCVLNAQYAP